MNADGLASFQSSGVGFISVRPDPDGAGPKVTVLSDKNKDGRNDLCFQSGYQMKNVAGDLEFRRLNDNSGMAGTQYVTWCSDSDRDGCSDEWNSSSIRIDWSADGTAIYSNDGDSSYSGWSRYPSCLKSNPTDPSGRLGTPGHPCSPHRQQGWPTRDRQVI